MAPGRGDGRRARVRDRRGDAPRRRDVAVALEYLPARARHRVDAAVHASGCAGALCGRRRGHVRHGSGVRAGRTARARDAHASRRGAAPGEDETRRPLARGGGLRCSGLSPAHADEWAHLGATTRTGVLPPAMAGSTRHAADSTAGDSLDVPHRVSSGPARDHSRSSTRCSAAGAATFAPAMPPSSLGRSMTTCTGGSSVCSSNATGVSSARVRRLHGPATSFRPSVSIACAERFATRWRRNVVL